MAKEVKHLDEQGIRLMLKLITGIKSNSDLALSKCIDLYDNSKVYNKNDICVFDNKLWLANTVVTNVEPSFTDTAHWTALDDEYNEISEQDIINMMEEVTPEQWTKLQEVIVDDQISANKVYSSSKVYQEDQNILAQAKQFTTEELGKVSTASYKTASDVSEVVDERFLYLIANSDGDLDIYALIEGSAQKIGNTKVDLTEYAKTAEIQADYLKSADADGKFATITSVDNHIGDTDVHVTKELKDKLLTSDDITTTIDSTSTDDQVAGALTTYNAIKNLIPYIASSVSSEDPNITTKALIRIKHDNAPTSDSEYFILTFFTDDTLEIVEKSQMAFCIGDNVIYTRTKKYNDSWTNWTKIATDSNATFSNLNLLDNPFFTVNQRGKTSYTGNVYTVDRWKIYNTDGLTVTVNSDGSLTITNSSTAQRYFGQVFNLNVANKLKGRRVTLSVDGYSTLGKGYMYSYYRSDNGNTTMTRYGDNTIKTERSIYSCTYEFPNFDMKYCEIFDLSISAGESVTIYSAKVELGEVSTLKNEEILDYNKELLRCQISTADASDTYTNRHIYTTKVADVPRTRIITDNTDITMNENAVYNVINGIAYVTVWGFKVSAAGTHEFTGTTLPKPALISAGASCDMGSTGNTGGYLYVTGSGVLKVDAHSTESLYCSFSYPVSES